MRISVAADERTGVADAVVDELKRRGHEPLLHGALAEGERDDWAWASEEAAEQELAPLLIRKPLQEYLDRQGLGSGQIEAERIGEGHSNVTFLIERGEDKFVLRRPPRPPIPPSANDVLREARLLMPIQDA